MLALLSIALFRVSAYSLFVLQIEPEVAFNDINDNMDLAEEFIKYCVQWALDNCYDDVMILLVKACSLLKESGVDFNCFSSSSFFHTLPAISCNCGISISSTSFFALYWSMMEFKLNGTAEEAMQQIEEKGYASAFASDSRKVIKVGVKLMIPGSGFLPIST